jgi:c-di-GMP-related signal transduction protein
VPRYQGSPGQAVQEVHVGCQPIYDSNRLIFGYELFFRDSSNAESAAKRTTSATSDVIRNVFSEPNTEKLIGGRRWFINVTRDFLVGDTELPISPARVVLEITDSAEPDYEMLRSIQALAKAGYRVAIDRLTVDDCREQILPFASYVKIDMHTTSRDDLKKIANSCSGFNNISMIGMCIETDSDLTLAQSLPCRLFQGYLLARPRTISTRTISPSRSHYFELIKALNDDNDTDISAIASIVKTDPALSLMTLHACNAAASGLSHHVTSIDRAVSLAGRSQLRRWTYLLMTCEFVESDQSNLTSIIEWSRLYQLLAPRLGVLADVGFLAGILSESAQLLGTPIGDFVAQFPISGDVATSIVERSGPIGQLLDLVSAYQNDDHSSILKSPVSPSEIVRLHHEAATYSDQMTNMISQA